MASTGTQPSKTQDKGTTSSQSTIGQTGTGQTGSSQPSGTQGGTGTSAAQGTQASGSLTTASNQGQQGVSRRGAFSPGYFPSTAEFFSNPFGVMRRMHEEMDRAFAEAFSGSGRSAARGVWTPLIDVAERQGNLVVHAELPGVKPNDVQIEVDNDALVISGKREASEEREEQGVHRRERTFGSFYRAIPLPEGTDTENARAQFNDGVLEVTLPMPKRQSQARRIPIGESR